MNREVLRILTIVFILVYFITPSGYALEVSKEELIKYIDISRDLLDKALEAYSNGDYEEAFEYARDAYLLGFELVEPPLRGIDAEFVLDIEFRFAELRSLIKAGAPYDDVRAKVLDILDKLDKTESLVDFISDPAVAVTVTSALIYVSSSIIVREGIEAILLIGLINAYIIATRNYKLRKGILSGILSAALALIVTWYVLSYLISISGFSRAVIEAGLATIAFIILIYFNTSMLMEFGSKKWLEFVRAKVWAKASAGGILTITFLTFSIIYREGFEAIILFQILMLAASGFEPIIYTGLFIGIGIVAVAAILLTVFEKKVPITKFIYFTFILTLYLGILLIGTAVEELQELGYINETPLPFMAEVITPAMADVFGLHPTLEVLVSQVAVLVLYSAIFIYFLRRARSMGVE